MTGSVMPMQATIDSVGGIVVPKPLRDALGLVAGSTVDISRYGAGSRWYRLDVPLGSSTSWVFWLPPGRQRSTTKRFSR